MGILDYFTGDKDLSAFNGLLNKCGDRCRDIFRHAESDSFPYGSMEQHGRGFTLFIPTNDYFFDEEIQKFEQNLTLFHEYCSQRVFYGTWCESFLSYKHGEVENVLGELEPLSNFLPFVSKFQAYLSINSVLVHKISALFLKEYE